MKTLRGKPIEGNLLSLYKYYFLPGGNYKEAEDLAEANDMRNELKVLIENQLNHMNELIRKIRHYTSDDRLNNCKKVLPGGVQQIEGLLPKITAKFDYLDVIIARHAATGEYKINVEFEILGVKATDDKPEYFCDEVEFYISTIRGNNQVFSPKQVPAHLIDANFHNACFRAAMGLHIAINMTWEKFRGFDTPFRKDVVINHNLPNYPPIIAYQKLVKYE